MRALLSAAAGLLLTADIATAQMMPVGSFVQGSGITAPTATVYYAGEEDSDFAVSGGSPFWGATGRANWSRSAASVTCVNDGLSGGTTFPSTAFIQTPQFTSISNFWLHSYATFSGVSQNYKDLWNLIAFAGPDGVWRFALQMSGITGTYRLIKRDAAGTITVLATGLSNLPLGPGAIDLQVTYSAIGSASVYFAGSNIADLTYSGDLTTDGATQINQIFYGCPGVNSASWGENIIADKDTRGWGLLGLIPVGPGNTDAWTPSAGTTPCGAVSGGNQATYLAAVPANDSNNVAPSTSSQTEECVVATYLSGSSYNSGVVIPTCGGCTVKATVMSARGQMTGALGIGAVQRTGGADYVGAKQPTNSFVPSFQAWSNIIQATNPATGGAWATTDLTAAGLNLGLKSLP